MIIAKHEKNINIVDANNFDRQKAYNSNSLTEKLTVKIRIFRKTNTFSE